MPSERDDMERIVKEVIVLGKKEEEAGVLKLCLAWQPFFQKKEWKVRNIFIGRNAEQTLMEIADSKADMVVCFNLAGFHVTMFGGDIFLNKLYCPIVNIVWQPFGKKELELLNSRLNVTIVFFTNVRENVSQVKERLDFPPYIQYISDLQRFWEEADLERVLLYGEKRF